MDSERDIIVIGTSNGGFSALPKLMAQFPADFPAAFFVIQHLGSGATASPLVEKIQKETSLICQVASHSENIEYGHIYVAPPDHHMLFKKGQIMIIRGPRENRFRPSIDMLFRSAAAEYKSKVIGVILTGMLDDGTSGLEAIMKAGGIAVIQDPNEAEFPEMPVSAIRNLAINHVAPISEMGNLIKKLINEPFEENNPVPKHILREAEIAERYITGIDNIENVEKIGKQIPISCPDCGGALWQISESNIPRFRCHVGHAFNGAGLLRSHSKAMEETLWVSLRMLEERLHMLVTMYENQTKSNNHKLAATIPERMEEVKVHISRIRQILTSNEVYKGFSESL